MTKFQQTWAQIYNSVMLMKSKQSTPSLSISFGLPQQLVWNLLNLSPKSSYQYTILTIWHSFTSKKFFIEINTLKSLLYKFLHRFLHQSLLLLQFLLHHPESYLSADHMPVGIKLIISSKIQTNSIKWQF